MKNVITFIFNHCSLTKMQILDSAFKEISVFPAKSLKSTF